MQLRDETCALYAKLLRGEISVKEFAKAPTKNGIRVDRPRTHRSNGST